MMSVEQLKKPSLNFDPQSSSLIGKQNNKQSEEEIWIELKTTKSQFRESKNENQKMKKKKERNEDLKPSLKKNGFQKNNEKKNKLQSENKNDRHNTRTTNSQTHNFQLVIPNPTKNKKKYSSKTPRGNTSEAVVDHKPRSDCKNKMFEENYGGFVEHKIKKKYELPNFLDISDLTRKNRSKSNNSIDYQKKQKKKKKKKKKKKEKREKERKRSNKLSQEKKTIKKLKNLTSEKKQLKNKSKESQDRKSQIKTKKTKSKKKRDQKDGKTKKNNPNCPTINKKKKKSNTKSFTGKNASSSKSPDIKSFEMASEGGLSQVISKEITYTCSGSNEYNYEEEDEKENLPYLEKENPEDYKKGGYHPVKPGDIFKERYKALIKIGWGYFSTVWLVEDLKYGGKMVRTKTGNVLMKEKYLALKIVKSSKIFAQVAIDEIKILFKCALNDPEDKFHIVRLTDHFTHKGPNGRHICMVFEFLDQNHLLTFLNKYGVGGLPIDVVKEITLQTLIGIDHLHSRCQVIHTDIKPENIMIYTKPGNIPSCLKKKLKRVQRQLEKETRIKKRKKGKRQKETNSKSSQSQEKKKKLQKVKKKYINEMILNDYEHNSKINYDKNFFSSEISERQSKTRMINTMEEQRQPSKQETKNPQTQQSEKNIKPQQSNDYNISIEETNCEIKHTLTSPNDQFIAINLPSNIKTEIKKPTKKKANIIPKQIKCKIVDLGNACWFDQHFSSLIQTREYRCPEVIIGHGYNEKSDIWSMACMIFELLTGEVLFQPISDDPHLQDEEHLALMISLLGEMPPDFLLTGKHSKLLTDQNGNLLHFKNISSNPLKKRLIKSHNFSTKDARQIASFLLPMLHYDPNKRVPAKQCLKHSWLKIISKN
ncbi:hypothetical protein M0812_19824 [Anaeramoeba flamelloides]|uniref:non-specific serine/threonine protein kinase n=1 Tax=Anaeramoeba flamelloides TaxID=1746091 RepID=A0AAV7Z063_9EUKA|nr:hypothetical protein M0812_19824 [Anaeramoeba flamelloides]